MKKIRTGMDGIRRRRKWQLEGRGRLAENPAVLLVNDLRVE
jgi:hypothetical protein